MTSEFSQYYKIRHNFLVTPAAEGTNKRHLILSQQTEIELFEHFRCFPNKTNIVSPANTKPTPNSNTINATKFTKKAIYAGFLYEHFGHFIAESLHRLWILKILNCNQTFVVFHVGQRANGQYRTQPPEYVFNILDIFGISKERIILIDRVIEFSEIYFPIQGRYLGKSSCIPNYTEAFFGSHPHNDGRKIYVSRSRYLSKGSYFGERLVESILSRNGFTVMLPELQHPASIIKQFREASEIVFSEGSAIHLLELCGKISARITIIMRRSDKFRQIFEPVVSSATETFQFVMPQQIIDPLDWDTAVNRPHSNNAPCIIDIQSLLDLILGAISTRVPKELIAEAVRNDALRYICSADSTSTKTSDEQLGSQLRKLRKTVARVPWIMDLSSEHP